MLPYLSYVVSKLRHIYAILYLCNPVSLQPIIFAIQSLRNQVSLQPRIFATLYLFNPLCVYLCYSESLLLRIYAQAYPCYATIISYYDSK